MVIAGVQPFNEFGPISNPNFQKSIDDLDDICKNISNGLYFISIINLKFKNSSSNMEIFISKIYENILLAISHLPRKLKSISDYSKYLTPDEIEQYNKLADVVIKNGTAENIASDFLAWVPNQLQIATTFQSAVENIKNDWCTYKIPDNPSDFDKYYNILLRSNYKSKDIQNRLKRSQEHQVNIMAENYIHTKTDSRLDSEMNIFYRFDDGWKIRFEGEEQILRHSKGLHCIAILLSKPKERIKALQLAHAIGTSMVAESDANATLGDRDAIALHRESIADLKKEFEEAERNCDPIRAEKLRDDIERAQHAFLQEYSSKVSIKPFVERDSITEKARKAVQSNIRLAKSKLGKKLQKHLSCLKTGSSCIYEPPVDVTWDIKI